MVEGEILSQTSHWFSQRDQTNFWLNPIRDLVQALLVGEKQSFDPQSLQVYENEGLSHLLAILGLQMGLVLAPISSRLGHYLFQA